MVIRIGKMENILPDIYPHNLQRKRHSTDTAYYYSGNYHTKQSPEHLFMQQIRGPAFPLCHQRISLNSQECPKTLRVHSDNVNTHFGKLFEKVAA